MFKKGKVILRECPSQVLPSQLHQCALNWSEKCAHYDKAFDELKKKQSSSIERNEDTFNE